MANFVCYRMNNSLSEIQADIQRLTNQQNQIQQQQLMSQHQKQMQQQLHQLQSFNQQQMQVRCWEYIIYRKWIVLFQYQLFFYCFNFTGLWNATNESIGTETAGSSTVLFT